jgi:ABC-type transport system involved in cytochrome c biogenesis permease component
MNPYTMDLLMYVLFSMLVGAAGWMACITRARTACQAVAIRYCSRALLVALLLLPLIFIHLFLDANITATATGWLLYYGGYYSFIVFTLGSVIYVWIRVKRCNATCQAQGHQRESYHHGKY